MFQELLTLKCLIGKRAAVRVSENYILWSSENSLKCCVVDEPRGAAVLLILYCEDRGSNPRIAQSGQSIAVGQVTGSNPVSRKTVAQWSRAALCL